jgi:predicted restriction endonuclease
MMLDLSEFYIDKKNQGIEKYRVIIRIAENLLKVPILLEDLRKDEIISKDNYLINGFERASMPLREDAFKRIMQKLGKETTNTKDCLENERVNSFVDIANLERKYKDASPQVKEIISKKIERGKVSSQIKEIYEYKCKLCEALHKHPLSFKKTDGVYYIETHHITPVSNLEKGSLGVSNLITLCANHHRQFHYGDIEVIENKPNQLKVKIDGQNTIIEKKIIACA